MYPKKVLASKISFLGKTFFDCTFYKCQMYTLKSVLKDEFLYDIRPIQRKKVFIS